MQALRRRTKLAADKVSRRQKEHNLRLAAATRRERANKEHQRNDVKRFNTNVHRQERWEEWNLGPLRAKRVELKKIPKEIKMSNLEKVKLIQAKRKQEREERKRKGHELRNREMKASPEYHVAQGDRVVIRAEDGPIARYRGKIGRVLAVSRGRKCCAVEGMTIRQARVVKEFPQYKLFNTPSSDPEYAQLIPIPFSHIRVVKTVVNSAGQKEDVILGRLSPQDLIAMGRGDEVPDRQSTIAEPLQPTADDEAALPDPAEPESEDQRLARVQSQPNLDPEQAAQLPPSPTSRPAQTGSDSNSESDFVNQELYKQSKRKDPTQPGDTFRLTVDTPSWTPTLLRAPLPGSVIDELRGKYSVFRTRHDEDYVKRLQRNESRRREHDRWVKAGGGLLDTPRKEAVLRSQAKRKSALPGLKEEVLEGIGKVMWERGMRLDGSQQAQAQADQRWNRLAPTLPKGGAVGILAAAEKGGATAASGERADA